MRRLDQGNERGVKEKKEIKLGIGDGAMGKKEKKGREGGEKENEKEGGRI